MEQRLTTQQLNQIVGEVGRLANRQQEELDRSEVQKILQELNIYIVVGPGIESCSAGKDGKEAIVVNNSD